MEPRCIYDYGYGNGSSSQRTPVDQIQEVLSCLDQLPALRDVMIPQFALDRHEILAQQQVLFTVAHAYIHRPLVVYRDLRSAACREGHQWGC